MASIESYVAAHEERYLRELGALLSIPSVSSNPGHREDMQACAALVAGELRRAGVGHAEVIATPGHPVVYGEWLGAPDRPTALIYGHYDVQPVDPLDLWTTPPFEPSVRDGALFARGAADDKGQVFMHLKAAEAHFQLHGGLPLNVKFLIEGEEEVGSTNLDDFIAANRERLRADVAVVSDTAMFARGVPSLTYGLRGIAYFQINVFGPQSDLHSGSFGGAIANPAQVLVEILAALHDRQGRVSVPGFYDDVRPPTPGEREEFARLPFDEERYREELGVPQLYGEEGYTTLERVWARPTLEINGIWGGFTGEGSKTVLPACAGAKVSCRLVSDQDPQRVFALVERHIRALCPPTVRLEFTSMHAGKPCITPLDHPAVQAAARALERGFGKRPVFTRTGGSIPVVASFAELLGLPTVLMGIGLPDEHSHAPNERLELANLFGGIRSAYYLWQELAGTDQG